jgi:hypothetical protein
MEIISKLLSHSIADIAKMIYDERILISFITMHSIMFVSPIIITLMTNDLSILVLVSLFLYSILTINIVFHDCPLSIIENRCLGGTMIDTVSGHLQTDYNNEQRGNITVQWLFMAIATVNAKIFLLLLKHCFFTYLSE